jgi:tetrahydromethanopterin S-methyltransferase subunit G
MWTDHRLSERFDAIDKRFDAIDQRFDNLERRMDEGFAHVNGRLDALQRTMLQTNAIIIAALIGIIATQL